MYFRELIESTHDKHTRGSRKEKCNITWNIVDEVLARNGRFLDWSSEKEVWIVATDREKIRKKVAACYKQYNRMLQQQQRIASQKTKSSPKKTDESDSKAFPKPISESSQIADKSEQVLLSDSAEKPKAVALEVLREEIPAIFCTDDSNFDRRLREYYDAKFPSTKRRKMFAPCGSGYSSSDSSDYDFGGPR